MNTDTLITKKYHKIYEKKEKYSNIIFFEHIFLMQNYVCCSNVFKDCETAANYI